MQDAEIWFSQQAQPRANPNGALPMNRPSQFSLESLQDCDTICRYLEEIKEGFKKGDINFNHQGSSLQLKPHGLIKFEISAGHQDGEVKVNLNFRWREDHKEKFVADSAGPENSQRNS